MHVDLIQVEVSIESGTAVPAGGPLANPSAEEAVLCEMQRLDGRS